MKLTIVCLLVLVAAVSGYRRCVDIATNCGDVANLCHWRLVKNLCRKTCNVCQVPTRPPQTTPKITAAPSVPTGGDCGNVKVSTSRIISGTNARRGAWPWQILMLYNGRRGCGGSIISPTWVVTAAHCVSENRWYPQGFTVRVGAHDWYNKNGWEQDITVSRVIVHNEWSRNTLNNDIALFQLSKPITFNNYVQPVCLPSQDLPDGTNCYITGWGKIQHPGKMHYLLQQTDLPIVSNSVCYNYNRHTIPLPITKGMICGGHGGANRKSGCHGDSGGPYVCKVDGKWELHGAVSHGSPVCRASQTYTVFARVNYFKEWIKDNMAKYGA